MYCVWLLLWIVVGTVISKIPKTYDCEDDDVKVWMENVSNRDILFLLRDNAGCIVQFEDSRTMTRIADCPCPLKGKKNYLLLCKMCWNFHFLKKCLAFLFWYFLQEKGNIRQNFNCILNGISSVKVQRLIFLKVFFCNV